jgi:hypothetical protein
MEEQVKLRMPRTRLEMARPEVLAAWKGAGGDILAVMIGLGSSQLVLCYAPEFNCTAASLGCGWNASPTNSRLDG